MSSRANIIGAIEAKRSLDNCAAWRRAGKISLLAGVVLSVAALLGAGIPASVGGLVLVLAWYPCHWRQRTNLRAARRWLHGGAS